MYTKFNTCTIRSTYIGFVVYIVYYFIQLIVKRFDSCFGKPDDIVEHKLGIYSYQLCFKIYQTELITPIFKTISSIKRYYVLKKKHGSLYLKNMKF